MELNGRCYVCRKLFADNGHLNKGLSQSNAQIFDASLQPVRSTRTPFWWCYMEGLREPEKKIKNKTSLWRGYSSNCLMKFNVYQHKMSYQIYDKCLLIIVRVQIRSSAGTNKNFLFRYQISCNIFYMSW